MNYINAGKENSGSIDLHYEDHGSGKPVVLVHGWPLSLDSWEKQVPALLDAGYRVVSYDRRGFGHSSKPTFGYDYDTFADDLHKVITKLNLHNITLVGFSMGGGEVARYLGKYGADRIEKAVFMSAITPFLLKTPDNPLGVEMSVFDGIKKAIIMDRPAFLTQFFHNFYNADILKGKAVSEEVLRLSWYTAAMASPKGTLDCVSAWGTDFLDDVRAINIPTLIVHGTADRIVPFEASGKRMPGLIKDSRLVTLNDAPHGLNWTHAEEANRELLAFISGRVPAAA